MQLLILLTLSAFSSAQPAGKGGNPACAALKDACMKAGYVMTGPQTSDLSVIGGCMAKIARDEKVPRLMVKPTHPSIKPCVDFMKSKMHQITSAQKVKAPPPPPKPPAGHKIPPKKPAR